jgi:hypothetical protein
MGGFTPASAPAAASTPAAAKPAAKSSAAATKPTAPTDGIVEGATSGTDLTDKVKGLLPNTQPTAAAEPKKESGGLLGFLGLNRVPAVSIAEAQQTDVGRLLVGPVIAE